jgi:hypothetical protein
LERRRQDLEADAGESYAEEQQADWYDIVLARFLEMPSSGAR